MKSTSLLTVTVAAMALASTGAVAQSTFNFVSYADGGSFTDSTMTARTGGEGNWNKDVSGGSSAVVGDGVGIVENGITVWASGMVSDGGLADAFLDASGNAGPAGLGVCSSFTGDAYTPGCTTGDSGAVTSDDNLNRAVETLKLTFSETVNITGLTINDADHGGATGSFKIGNEVFVVSGGVVPLAALALIPANTMFTFGYINDLMELSTGDPLPTEVYIGDITVAAVPVPAAAWLFGSALMGLAGVARRRRAS